MLFSDSCETSGDLECAPVKKIKRVSKIMNRIKTTVQEMEAFLCLLDVNFICHVFHGSTSVSRNNE